MANYRSVEDPTTTANSAVIRPREGAMQGLKATGKKQIFTIDFLGLTLIKRC